MNLTQQTDHVAAGLARLLEQFKARPNLQALLTACLQRQQGLEDALFPLNSALQLDTAQGAQLDIIGQMVGASRNGLSDAQYRAFLTGQVAQNNGDSSLGALIAVIKGVFQTEQVFLKTPNNLHREGQVAPAVISVSIQNPGIPPEVVPVALASLRAALGAGVALNYLGTFRPKAFAFQGNQPWVAGFGSTRDASAGGVLGGRLFSDPIA